MDGIIFKGGRIVIPSSLKKDMLKIIQSSHLGVVKSKQRAKDILFWPQIGKDIELSWPQMGKDIKQVLSKCQICLECQLSNVREPMISEKPATRPWETISTDLFTWECQDYLLVAASYSHYRDCTFN